VFKDIIKKFEEYCTSRKNIIYIKHAFFSIKQKDGQLFSDFVTSIKKQAMDCEFNELKDSLVRDVIVLGVKDSRLRERMLRESNLSLEKAIRLRHSAEETTKHVEALQKEEHARA